MGGSLTAHPSVAYAVSIQGGSIMSDASAAGFGDFGKWVPGFEFLQSLTRPAGASAAAPGNWVAPTLSVEDLDKRIQELKAVLFWLEQNGTALKATIQALEVQKMTLSALKGMNVSLQDMAQAFGAKAPVAPAAATASAAPVWPPAAAQASAAQARAEPSATTTSQSAPPPKRAARSQAGKSRGKAASQGQAGAEAAAGMVDPMQWWGALTQQFQQIASAAVADAQARAADAPPAEQAGSSEPRTVPSRTPRSPRKSKPKASR
jgi:hypothetical protein